MRHISFRRLGACLPQKMERLHQRRSKGRLSRQLERSMVGCIVRRLDKESHLHLDGEGYTDGGGPSLDMSIGFLNMTIGITTTTELLAHK